MLRAARQGDSTVKWERAAHKDQSLILVAVVTAFMAGYAVFLVALVTAVIGVAGELPSAWSAMSADVVDEASCNGSTDVGATGCGPKALGERFVSAGSELVGGIFGPWGSSKWPSWIAAGASLYAAALTLALFARDQARSRPS